MSAKESLIKINLCSEILDYMKKYVNIYNSIKNFLINRV